MQGQYWRSFTGIGSLPRLDQLRLLLIYGVYEFSASLIFILPVMYVCHLIQEQVYYLQSEVLTFCCTQRLIKTSAIDHAISVLMGVKVSKVHDCIPIAHRDSQNFFRNADSKQYIVEGALSIEPINLASIELQRKHGLVE